MTSCDSNVSGQLGNITVQMAECSDAVQMAEWYGASASGSVDLRFDSKSGQTNDFRNGIHSFPA